MKNYTAEEWIASADFDSLHIYWHEADGEHCTIIVPAGEPLRVYGLRGKESGSITVTGDGDGSAYRSGDGDGGAWRDGSGYGNAYRSGSGNGNAWYDGSGNGIGKSCVL